MEKLIKQFNEQTTLVYSDIYQRLCVKKILDESSKKYLLQIQKLQLPHIPKVYEVTNNYVLLEYIEGVSLDKYKELFGNIEEPLLEKLIINICETLNGLHRHNLIHRDIKPQNIIITEQKDVYLIDFNTVRQVKYVETQDTELLGTRGYASPEHYGFKETDNRSDIYSLGMVIKMCSDGMHFSHKYKRIIEKTTAIDPKLRYQNVAELENAVFKIGKIKRVLKKELAAYDSATLIVVAVFSILIFLFSTMLGIFGTMIDENNIVRNTVTVRIGLFSLSLSMFLLIPITILLVVYIILKIMRKETKLGKVLLIYIAIAIGSFALLILAGFAETLIRR